MRERRQRARWMPHRQAYFPRMWPGLVLAVVVAEAVQLAGAPALGLAGWPRVLFGAFVGAVVGFGVARWRLVRWRRRHPPITPHEWLEAQRRAAPWN